MIKRILVTGAKGFIGKNLIVSLYAQTKLDAEKIVLEAK